VRIAGRARADFDRIAAFWEVNNPSILLEVPEAILSRIRWIASGNYSLGQPTPELGPEHRSVLERRFGYRIYTGFTVIRPTC